MPFWSLSFNGPNQYAPVAREGVASNVPETQDAEAGDHGGASESALTLRVYHVQRSEHIVHTRSRLSSFTQSMREYVEPVGLGVSKIRAVELPMTALQDFRV